MDSQTRAIPIKNIRRGTPLRTRVNRKSFTTIGSTMREQGQLVPIVVAPAGDAEGVFDLVDGVLRVTASEQQGLSTIRATVLDKPLSQGERQEKALICNVQREELNAIDLANAFLQYMQITGGTISSCAAKIGLDVPTITKKLALLKLPEAIQADIAGSKIPWSSGYELTHLVDPEQQLTLAQQLAAGQMTRDVLQGHAKRGPESKKGATGAVSKRVLVPLDGGRSVRITGAELDLDAVISCATELLALARRARKRGLELSSFVKMLKEQAQPQATEA